MCLNRHHMHLLPYLHLHPGHGRARFCLHWASFTLAKLVNLAKTVSETISARVKYKHTHASVTSNCVRRSVMSTRGQNGTPDTSLYVHRSIMSVMDFHGFIVSARGHKRTTAAFNVEQIITCYPIDGAMSSSGGGRVRMLSVVCLHNNAIVARCILVTMLHCGTPEPRLSAIYIVSSVGTSLCSTFHCVRSVVDCPVVSALICHRSIMSARNLM